MMNNEQAPQRKVPKEFAVAAFTSLTSAVLLLAVVAMLGRYNERLHRMEAQAARWELLLTKMEVASDVMEKASTNAQQTSKEIGELRKQTIRTAEQAHGVLLVTGKILEWMKEVQARHEKEDSVDTNFIIVSPEGHRVWLNNQRTNHTEQLIDVKE